MRMACGAILFVTGLWLPANCAAEDAEKAASAERALAGLLSRLKTRPLAVITVSRVETLSEQLAATHLGRMLLDKGFTDGRAAIHSEMSKALGTEVGVLWAKVSPHLRGPAALALTAVPSKEEGVPAAFRLTLHVGAAGEAAVDALRRAWPRVPPQSGKPIALVRMDAVDANSLSSDAAPVWATALAKKAARAAFHVFIRNRNLASALSAWLETQEEGLRRKTQPLANQMADIELRRIDWSVGVKGTEFVGRLDAQFLEGAKGSFAQIVSSLKEIPHPWRGLQAALPSNQDAAFLLQSDFGPLTEQLGLGLQVMERVLRGKKWTRRFGSDEDSIAPDRFKFITDCCGGTLGVTGRLSLTGEVRLVAASATRGNGVFKTRNKLVTGLRGLGASFQNQDRATPIGEHVPLAAQFKGRSFLPAPMIGLSDGWMWLCSTPSSYRELTSAFLKGSTLASDAVLGGKWDDALDHPLNPPKASSVQLRVNLTRIVPLLYTAWLLREGGPRIGDWEVPMQVLPPHLGFFKGRLGRFHSELGRQGDRITGFARSPIPGGELVLAGLLLHTSYRIDAHARRQLSSLRKKLERLEEPTQEARP